MMSEPHITEEQSESPSPQLSGRPLLILGGVMLFVGLYISVFLIPDVIQTLAGPQPVILQDAASMAGVERTYVRLEDGNWDCETLTPVRGFSPSHRRYEILREETKFTEIFFTPDVK